MDSWPHLDNTRLDVRISDMNWMQVEEYLKHDDRAVLPLGSTEQHSHLRLTVDCILPEKVAVDAAEPLGIPVFPVFSYGVTPYFREFPGTISLKVETHLRVVGDILDSMAHSGFRRILIVNGHGGNGAAQQFAQEWAADHPNCRVVFHNWWNAPKTWAKVQAIDPVASHGSWMENFPWTRLPGVAMPATQRLRRRWSIDSIPWPAHGAQPAWLMPANCRSRGSQRAASDGALPAGSRYNPE